MHLTFVKKVVIVPASATTGFEFIFQRGKRGNSSPTGSEISFLTSTQLKPRTVAGSDF